MNCCFWSELLSTKDSPENLQAHTNRQKVPVIKHGISIILIINIEDNYRFGQVYLLMPMGYAIPIHTKSTILLHRPRNVGY